MLIPNRFTNDQKPSNHSYLEVEPLDVRCVPALMNSADALFDAMFAADAVAAGGVRNAGVSAEQASHNLPGERAAAAPSAAPSATAAATFPAADAALAATRPAAPDAFRAIVPSAIANALQPGRLDLSPETRIPGAAPDNIPVSGQTLLVPPVPQPALPDTTSTIPIALQSSAPATASPPPLDMGEMRSPFPADPFQALGAAPATLAAPLPGGEPELSFGPGFERQEAVAEARSANIVVTWQPAVVVAEAVPNIEAAAAFPAATNLPMLDEDNTAKSAWPLAPAIAALYEIWYRGNRI